MSLSTNAHAEGDAPAPRHCQNCGAALQGRFCGFCGQRALRLDVSLRELLSEGVHEFVHLDKRILLTLRLLVTRPGRLTAEMLAGRRQRYISPIRLYLVCSVIFFLGLAALVDAPRGATPQELARDRDLVTAPGERGLSLDIKRGITNVAGDPKQFMTIVWNRAPKVAFALLPIFALLTMATFRRRVRFFVPHLYFALHFHSFMFLATLVLVALDPWTSLSLSEWAFPLGPLYLAVAARETFETGWGEAAWKSLLVSAVYGVVLTVVVGAVLVVSALSL